MAGLVLQGGPGGASAPSARGWAGDDEPWQWADDGDFKGPSAEDLDDLLQDAFDGLMYADDLGDVPSDAEFGPGGPAEAMPPGVPLHMLVEEAIADLAEMSDHAIVEVAAAARRLRSRAEWLELQATREFARRRWETDPEPVRRPDGKWRRPNSDAEHAADELAFRLTQSRRASEDQMELSLALRDRLPRMDAQLARGRADQYRCQITRDMTATLSDDDARLVDEMIAPDASGLRYDALRRRAAKLALRLDPASDRERKQRATRKQARVEAFPEKSGNYAFAGRELPIDQVLASEAHIRGLAQYLRARGIPGSLRELALMVYLDLTQGRDPRDRVPGGRAAERDRARDEETVRPDDRDRGDMDRGDMDRDAEDIDGAGHWDGSRGRAPFPAKISLLVPVGTAYGWSALPGEAGREIIDPATLREMLQAASRHRDSRWCVTLTGADGTAVAHGCARGQHTWNPPPAVSTVPGEQARDGTPTSAQLDQMEEFLHRLSIAFEPIAKGECDHRLAESRYRPSRKLRDRVRARNTTCPAPGCEASSARSDLDHTEHWPHGPTCECNFGVPCRHHHRTKQAPGWELEQPQPGVFTWTTPSGHVYYTGPTRYDT